MKTIRRIELKIGPMRKAEEFVVYPVNKAYDEPNMLKIQSDHRMCVIDTVTGKGLLSPSKPNGYHGALNPKVPGVTVVQFSPELIKTLIDAQPKSGDAIGGGMYIA